MVRRRPSGGGPGTGGRGRGADRRADDGADDGVHDDVALEAVSDAPRGRPARPIDLRLLPAALAAWAAAWAAIHAPADAAAGLGAILGGAGALLLGVLILLHRLMSPERRLLLTAAQVTVCCVAGAAVALSAFQTHRGLEATGWPQAVEAEVPVQVDLRVAGAPRETERPGPDGGARATARATILAYADRADAPRDVMSDHPEGIEPGSPGSSRRVGAEAVLLLGEESAAELTVGDRIRGMVRPVGTDPGDRATALLIPFGVDSLTPMHSRSTGDGSVLPGAGEAWGAVRQAVREGTVAASAGTVGHAPELLPGLILGDRSGQGHEITASMRAAGMTHLTVVSGTHCALVMGALLGLLRLLRTPRVLGLLLALLGLGLYVGLVDPAPSVVRAAVMGALGALALFSGRRRVSFSLLCVCVLGMLIWDPWFAGDPAMQLSVAATAGIILTGAPIQEALGRVLPGVVAGPAALAISAQLFVTPVLLPLSGGVTTYAVPANLLAAPLLPLVTVPGLLGAVLTPVAPQPAGALLWLCGLPAAAIGWIGRRAADMPQAVAAWPEGLTGAALVGLYVLAVVLLTRRLMACGTQGAMRQRSGAGTDGAHRGGSGSGRRRDAVVGVVRAGALVWSCAAVAGALTALVLPARSAAVSGAMEGWSAVMCDVGQGDMLVVRSGPRSAVVVDAGEEPHRADACLSRLQVDTVETLFITHEHRDHYGGIPGVVEGRAVGEVIYGGSADWTPHSDPELKSALDEVPVRRASPGEASGAVPPTEQTASAEAGRAAQQEARQEPGARLASEGSRWQVWLAHQHHAEPNDNSLVVLFELVDGAAVPGAPGSPGDPWRLLATGDLEEDAARLALLTGGLPEHVDILKVAHHGAANGGTQTLEATSPAVALIGVGDDNPYGHPAPSISQTLEELGTAVYRTDLHGGIMLRLEAGQMAVDSLGTGPD